MGSLGELASACFRELGLYCRSFSNFLRFGELSFFDFAEIFEVSPEVMVQCFLGVKRGHFEPQFQRLGLAATVVEALLKVEQRFSSFRSIESLPRKNR